MIVIVVVSFSSPGDDAISGPCLPNWTKLCNRGDSSIAPSSRSYLDIGVRCRTFRETSFQIGIRRDDTRTNSKLPSSLYTSRRRSLSHSPSAPQRIHVESPKLNANHQSELTRSFTQIRHETDSNQADTPSIHSTSTARPSSCHGLPRLQAHIGLLLPQGPSA